MGRRCGRTRGLGPAGLLLVAMLAAAPAASAAPTWLAPLTLSGPNTKQSFCLTPPCPPGFVQYFAAADTKVAMDPSGDAIVLYGRYDSGSGNTPLFSRRRDAGQTFSAPAMLADNYRTLSGGGVAMDAQGDALALWTGAAVNAVFAASALPGQNFGAAQQISSVATTNSPYSAFAMDPGGDAVAVWTHFVSGSTLIEASARPAGGSFPSTGTAISQGNVQDAPSVAMDAQGDAIAVWNRDTTGGGSYKIEAAFRPAGGAFGTPTVVGSVPYDANPHVAMDPQGNAVVVWLDSTSKTIDAAVRLAGGSFSGSGTPVSGAGVASVTVPQVALDGHGDAIAVWSRDQGGSQYKAEAAIWPVAGSLPAAGTPISGTGVSAPVLVAGPANTLAMWIEPSGSNIVLDAAARLPGGAFGAPAPIETRSSGNQADLGLGLDGAGDGIAAWTVDSQDRTQETVLAAGYDGAGPELRSLSMPGPSANAGDSLGFSVGPFDVWSPVASTSWDFGDGTTATGATVGHAYASGGTFTPVVTATDAVGNSTTAGGSINVTGPPSGPLPTADVVPPALTAVSLLHKVFAVGPRPTAIAAKRSPRGTAFRYTLSEASVLRITIARAMPGRKSGRRCVKPTPKLRKKRACVRYVPAGTLTRSKLAAGPHSTPFSGRIGKRALKPGSYRATLMATDAAGNKSAPKTVTFRIVRR